MGNMLKATVTIKGVRPLLWNHFAPEALPLEKKEKTGVAGNDPLEWKKKVLVTNRNQLYLEPTYIFGMMTHAAKFTKKGKGSIQPMVAATLQCIDEIVLVDRFLPDNIAELANAYEEPVFLHIASVKNPTTKGRNVRYRVAANIGWRATFNIIWDKTIVSRNEIASVLNDAGRLVGLADGRGIGYGRFEVENIEVVDLDA